MLLRADALIGDMLHYISIRRCIHIPVFVSQVMFVKRYVIVHNIVRNVTQ
jgi:hypothetical protein